MFRIVEKDRTFFVKTNLSFIQILKFFLSIDHYIWMHHRSKYSDLSSYKEVFKEILKKDKRFQVEEVCCIDDEQNIVYFDAKDKLLIYPLIYNFALIGSVTSLRLGFRWNGRFEDILDIDSFLPTQVEPTYVYLGVYGYGISQWFRSRKETELYLVLYRLYDIRRSYQVGEKDYKEYFYEKIIEDFEEAEIENSEKYKYLHYGLVNNIVTYYFMDYSFVEINLDNLEFKFYWFGLSRDKKYLDPKIDFYEEILEMEL